MSENTENTGKTGASPEGTAPENKQSVVQFSGRVLLADKAFADEIIRKHPVFKDGFAALMQHAKKGLIDIDVLEPEPDPEPAKTEPAEKKPYQYLMTFEKPLIEKLTNLRRFMKEKGDIPKECTEIEFLERIVSRSLESYIKRNFSFLDR